MGKICNLTYDHNPSRFAHFNFSFSSNNVPMHFLSYMVSPDTIDLLLLGPRVWRPHVRSSLTLLTSLRLTTRFWYLIYEKWRWLSLNAPGASTYSVNVSILSLCMVSLTR
jgi:hypothetical protein